MRKGSKKKQYSRWHSGNAPEFQKNFISERACPGQEPVMLVGHSEKGGSEAGAGGRAQPTHHLPGVAKNC